METKNKIDKQTKSAVEKYQCPGCTRGSNIECYFRSEWGIGCGKHSAGTFLSGVGKILLGMPKGFNRVGPAENMHFNIFMGFEDHYNEFNVPVWKYRNKKGHILVRGLMPRRNETFIHIYLDDCLDKIKCTEITEQQINDMD